MLTDVNLATLLFYYLHLLDQLVVGLPGVGDELAYAVSDDVWGLFPRLQEQRRLDRGKMRQVLGIGTSEFQKTF